MEVRESDGRSGRRRTSFIPIAENLNASGLKAIKRAEADRPFFGGEEALQEVAKPDGIWNWALVGPDPENLPLSGGGPGGIEEMQEAMTKLSHAYGILRVEFKHHVANKITRVCFVTASDDTRMVQKKTVKQRGQEMLMEPRMEGVMSKVTQINGKVKFNSADDITVDNLLQQLRGQMPQSLDLLTRENYLDRTAHWETANRKRPWESRGEMRARVKHWELVKAPPGRAAAAPDVAAERNAESEMARQRSKIKRFEIGDVVEVYSLRQQSWIADGEIADMVKEKTVIDGFKIRAGSVKVLFDNGTRYKWVAPQQVTEHIRRSTRPRPPPALVGTLEMEVSLEDSVELRVYHVEVNKGFLQWWESAEDAKQGMLSVGMAYLLGLQMDYDEEKGQEMRFKADATQGAIYCFRFESDEEAQKWMTSLFANAGFCEEVRDFFEAKEGKLKMHQDLLDVMKKRASASQC